MRTLGNNDAGLHITEVIGVRTMTDTGSAASASAFGKAHVPWGADGVGVYSAATLGCFNVVRNAQQLAANALQQALALTRPTGFVRLADYGTADGGTSMPLLLQLVDTVRRHDRTLQVEVSYEDQPNNDFRSLFYHTQGIRALPGNPPALAQQPGVFITASGTSFFQQCFPTASVHFGMSFTAMHWLSRQPGPLDGGIHMTQLQDPQQRAAWAAQAAADWQAILLNRAAELCAGGQLLLVNFCASPDQQWLGHTDIGPCMYGTMDRLWKQLAAEGVITAEEEAGAAFINYYRSEGELLAPFQEGGAAAGAGLRLVSHEFRVVRCPFRAAWLDGSSQATGRDAKAHAAWYVPTLRTWSNSTFLSALSNTRSEAERVAVVDELFRRYEAEVAAAPELHGMDYVHCYMHIEKAIS